MRLHLPTLVMVGVVSFSTAANETNTTINSSQSLELLDVVRLTLENSPNIKLQELGVKVAKAQERIAMGAFDVNTYARVGYSNQKEILGIFSQMQPPSPPPGDLPDLISDDHDVQFLKGGFSKGFRTGISTDLSLLMVRNDPRQRDISAPATFTENRTTVSFTINIPLLQGRGRVSAAAEETAARLAKQASWSDFQHSISATVLESIKAYWDYKAAVEFLNTQTRSEKRIQGWVNMASTTDNGLQGYLEDKKGKVIDATQRVEESKITLANTMGTPAAQVEKLGHPTADVPMDWNAVLANFDQQVMRNQWIAKALEKRLDLQATQLRLQAKETQLAKARQDVLPRLDLDLSTGYKGFTQYDGFDTYVDSFDNNVRGMDSSVRLTLSYPLGNNVAKGVLDLRQALRQQHLIQTNEKRRSIRLEVGNEVVNLHGRLQKVVQTEKTVKSYYQSVQKLQQDTSFLQDTVKLLSLIELENKLIQALDEYFIALRDLANAVAQIRFQTGTLLVVGDTISDVRLENITSLPDRF